MNPFPFIGDRSMPLTTVPGAGPPAFPGKSPRTETYFANTIDGLNERLDQLEKTLASGVERLGPFLRPAGPDENRVAIDPQNGLIDDDQTSAHHVSLRRVNLRIEMLNAQLLAI